MVDSYPVLTGLQLVAEDGGCSRKARLFVCGHCSTVNARIFFH
jgi:hypothetical protein